MPGASPQDQYQRYTISSRFIISSSATIFFDYSRQWPRVSVENQQVVPEDVLEDRPEGVPPTPQEGETARSSAMALLDFLAVTALLMLAQILSGRMVMLAETVSPRVDLQRERLPHKQPCGPILSYAADSDLSPWFRGASVDTMRGNRLSLAQSPRWIFSTLSNRPSDCRVMTSAPVHQWV